MLFANALDLLYCNYYMSKYIPKLLSCQYHMETRLIVVDLYLYVVVSVSVFVNITKQPTLVL